MVNALSLPNSNFLVNVVTAAIWAEVLGPSPLASLRGFKGTTAYSALPSPFSVKVISYALVREVHS